jgi:hypothetical protein
MARSSSIVHPADLLDAVGQVMATTTTAVEKSAIIARLRTLRRLLLAETVTVV